MLTDEAHEKRRAAMSVHIVDEKDPRFWLQKHLIFGME